MEIDDGDIDWYGRADDGMLGLGCGSSGSWGGVGEDLGRVPFSGSLRGRRGIARSATTVVHFGGIVQCTSPGNRPRDDAISGGGSFLPGEWNVDDGSQFGLNGEKPRRAVHG